MHHQAHRFDGCGRGKGRDETRARYAEEVAPAMTEGQIIKAAIRILKTRMRPPGESLSSPATVIDYLRLTVGNLEHEEFGVLWLDAKNRLINDERMFRGTITQTSVYPREVVKSALAHNAAGCILYHNHPSGNPEASAADQMLTDNLKAALQMVDVKALDHIIIAGCDSCSFAQRGLI